MSIKIKLFSVAILACSLASPVYAISDGMFFGFQAGSTNIHNNATQTTTTQPSNTGMGERLFMGYNFNPYFALEGGYTHYAPSTFNNVPNTVNNPTIRENGVDFVGKGTYPIMKSGIGIFAKAGLSMMRVSYAGSLNASGKGSTTNSARPIIGLGASYDLNQHWVTDLSWTRVLSGGSVKAADFIALGIAYHITAEQCGQFLC